MDIKKFEKDMTVFGFKQHQEVLTYLTHLEKTGWTIENVKTWVKVKKEKIIKTNKEYMEKTKRNLSCPICKTPMYLFPVNDSPGTQTGNPKDKCVWFCRECGESIYMQESIEKIYKEMGGK